MNRIHPGVWNIDNVPLGKHSIIVIDSTDILSSIEFPVINETLWSIVCTGGSIMFTIDGMQQKMTPSSIMVFAPGHRIESIVPAPDFKGFAISTVLKNLEAMLPVLSRALVCFKTFNDCPIIPLSEKELQNQILLHHLLKNKIEETGMGSLYRDVVIERLCEAAIFEILNLYLCQLQTENNSVVRHTRTEQLFYRFIVLVENRFRKTRLLSDYAKSLCVSTKHLSALVKEISGQTAGSWIDHYVVAEAKRLLTTTQMSVQEISEELNFANQSFFGKYFKHITGFSPTAYRNNKE